MRKNGSPLTRQRILQAALALLDEQGPEGLSMRKLAAALGVEAMSLYNHVQDKRDLLNGLTDLVIAQIAPPDAALPWDRRLEHIALGLYQALVRHPFLVMVLSTETGYPSDPRVLQGMDSIAAALAEAGLGPTRQVNAYRGLLAICLGSVFVHTQGLTRTGEQAQKYWDEEDSLQYDPTRMPHLAALSPYFKQTHAEDDFRFILEAYLASLRSMAGTAKNE